MRQYCIIFLLLIGLTANGQLVAEDWTMEDCAGLEHNLYSTLDTGSAVVMEIVMLDGCMPCINAAHWMEPVIDAFNAAYDGRVQWYTFGYNNSYSCTELGDWKTANTIGCDAQFVHGAEVAAYYGGMGMPTIVVAGRTTHAVYFNQFGFVPADTVAFAQAIAYALGLEDPTTVWPAAQILPFSVYPNPASDYIHLPIPEMSWPSDYTISDALGRRCLSGQLNDASLRVGALEPGVYTLMLHLQGSVYKATFIRSH